MKMNILKFCFCFCLLYSMTITLYDFDLSFLKLLLKTTLYGLKQDKVCLLFCRILEDIRGFKAQKRGKST